MANLHTADFIQSFNAEEIKITKEYISKLHPGENKIRKLFEILTSNQDKTYSDKDLSVLLKSQRGAVRVLKSRLFDCIKEALVLDKHFENEFVFNARDQLVYTLKKRILLIKSTYKNQNQKRIETITVLLKDCIKLAIEHQIYDVLCEALTLQKHIMGIRYGFQKFDEINKQIDFYTYCFKSVQEANDAFSHLTLNVAFVSALTQKEKYDFLYNSIKKMETDYKKTKSDEVNYYMHVLKMALFEHNKKFREAFFCCKKVLFLVENNSINYNKDRIGFALGNLSYFSILMRNYREALTYSKKSLKYHHTNGLHFLINKEQEFYAHFYSKDYRSSQKCIDQMLQHSLVDSGPYRKSKFIFYKACIFFQIKDFKSTIQLLNKSLEIEKDKAGWNISLRILMIMIHIELAKFKDASISMATLRKHMERNGKTKEISPRDNLIFKLLRELEKDHFKRNNKNKAATKLLNELSDKDKPTAWNHFTPEMIPFHEWVMTLPVK